MRHRLCILTIALLLAGAGTAAASFVEDTTGVHYQNDGAAGRDAPDACGGEGSPLLVVPSEGAGQLVPVDDLQDHWALRVAETDVGSALVLHVSGHDGTAVGGPLGFELAILVREPGCGDEVVGDAVPLGQDRAIAFVPEVPGDYDVGVALVADPNGSLEDVTPGVAVTLGYHCEPFCAFDYELAVAR